MKFIFEEMDLEIFYYGNIPLILNGRKQEVTAFEANENQIESAIEMFRQFPCKYFKINFRGRSLMMSSKIKDISTPLMEGSQNVHTKNFKSLPFKN